MPTRRVLVTSSYVKLWPTNPARVAASIFVPTTATYSVRVYDETPISGDQPNFIVQLEPGDFLSLSAFEGHDLSKPWHAYAAANEDIQVYEEFLYPQVMKMLEGKGIDSTHELIAAFVLSALAGGNL